MRIVTCAIGISISSALLVGQSIAQPIPLPADGKKTGPGILDLPARDRAKSPHALQDPQTIEDLNPIFLQIALGTIRDDRTLLLQSVKDLDRAVEKRPQNRIPAGFAKLLIHEQISDGDAFGEQFAEIVEWKRVDADTAVTVWNRLNPLIIKLAKDQRQDWIAGSVKRAGPRIWPGADATSVWVAQNFAPTLVGYAAQSDYLKNLQGESKKLWEDESYPTDLRELWSAGRQDLAKISIELHASHFAFEAAWSELQAYLEEFGSEGKHSRHLFGLVIDTLNRARSQKIDFDSATIPSREWFDQWHEQLREGGTSRIAKRLSDAWVVFDAWKDEPLPLGPVSSADLIRDPQLRIPFVGEFEKPTLRTVLDQASTRARIKLCSGPTTDPDLVIAAAVSFSGPLHAALRIIAEQKSVQGEWERTSDGYVLHSSQKNPTDGLHELKSGNSIARLVLIGANLFVVGIMLHWFLSRRRTINNPADRQPIPSSENGTE